MERILLIEDDQALGRGIALALAGEGREIRVAATLAQGRAALGEEEYALVLLDLNLPDGNGLDFLTALRRTSGVPVLILTANDLESDQVAGLELGADDYIVKPFSIRELLARIEAVLRRSPERPRQLREIRIPGATLDSANRLITFKDGRETSLTAREFEFLTYMATHPNRVITRDELLRRVWDVDPRLTDTRSVEMTVMRLRDKLGAASASPLETLRSQGYRWNSSFVS